MLIRLIIATTIFLSLDGQTCVEQYQVSKNEIGNFLSDPDFKIEIDQQFVSLHSPLLLEEGVTYTIQKVIFHDNFHDDPSDIHETYDRKYKKYYRYSHMQEFIQANSQKFKRQGYRVDVVGKSLRGRNLYAIKPEKIDSQKPIIVMFGRHHGDEGTANWIIEGFVQSLWENGFFDQYQLVLYPMINPDGAENHTRYNANSRDLNRVWGKTPESSLDEVKTIYTDLAPILKKHKNKIEIVLDMHGSFTEDFIYRVDRSFKTPSFYDMQEEFIQTLGKFDSYQGGNYQLSNGDPSMARIRLINKHGLNALTHESIRNIPKSSPRGIQELKSQGAAVLSSILSLY